MTLHGGKPAHAPESSSRSSPFAPLRALVAANAHDLDESLTKLASALATSDTPATIHLRVVDGDQIDHWAVKAGSKGASARRQQPKSANIHVVVGRDTWLEIAQGRLSPYDAVLGGRMRVGGNVELAKRVVKHPR